MSDEHTYKQAIVKLRRALLLARKDPVLAGVIEAKEEVLETFQRIFCVDRLAELTEEDFLSFLVEENNKHWRGLHRQGPKMIADMPTLQQALGILLDESQPIAERLDAAISQVIGMGRAAATAILQVSFPDKYGVWNSTSEWGLKMLGLWPESKRGSESPGKRYDRVNSVLNQLASDLQVDLWTLDAVWWKLERIDQDTGDIETPPEPLIGLRFTLERHLHDFLWENWARTSLGQEWVRYAESSEPEVGYEYPCSVGKIDVLAKHKKEPKWLVIELKRGQTSDSTVGQVLRYMGWVQNHLAQPGEKVEGLVIAHQANDRLRYAISMVPNVSLQTYEVQFKLCPEQVPGAERK